MLDATFDAILNTCSRAQRLIKNGEQILARACDSPASARLFDAGSSAPPLPVSPGATMILWPTSPLDAFTNLRPAFHSIKTPTPGTLTAGSAFVIKYSYHVAWPSCQFLVAICERLCVCGRDPYLVQLVICLPEDAEVRTTSPFPSASIACRLLVSIRTLTA